MLQGTVSRAGDASERHRPVIRNVDSYAQVPMLRISPADKPHLLARHMNDSTQQKVWSSVVLALVFLSGLIEYAR